MTAAALDPKVLIEAHSDRVRDTVDQFVLDLSEVTIEVEKMLGSYVRRSMEQSSGTILHSYANVGAMRELDREYSRALSVSGYHQVTASFIAKFSEQVDEFSGMYAAMRSAVPELPQLSFSQDDGGILAARAALSLASLEASTITIMASLRHAAMLTLGEVPVEHVVDNVVNIVGGMSRVAPLATNLLSSFFRNVAVLAYRNIEDAGTNLLYAYEGQHSEKNREFCAQLLENRRAYTKTQIAAMANGQVPSVFDNAGGYGCSHFWWVVGVAR